MPRKNTQKHQIFAVWTHSCATLFNALHEAEVFLLLHVGLCIQKVFVIIGRAGLPKDKAKANEFNHYFYAQDVLEVVDTEQSLLIVAHPKINIFSLTKCLCAGCVSENYIFIWQRKRVLI